MKCTTYLHYRALVLVAAIAGASFLGCTSGTTPTGEPAASQPPQPSQSQTSAKPPAAETKPAAGQPPAGESKPAAAKPAPSPTVPAKPTFGKAQIKAPDPNNLVISSEWGEVPPNQVAVVMKEGQSRQEAEKVAAAIGGAIVGEIEFMDLYQIETKGTTEADLKAALDKARQQPGVEAVAPNGRVYLQELACESGSPLKNPTYDGNNGRHYDIIGTQTAWDIIKASGIKLNDVHVGVMDDAVYDKSPDLKGRSPITPLEPQDATGQPETDTAGNVVDGGQSHGTMVSQVIAADADNGGMVGVASVLGDKLKLTLRNIYTAEAGFKEDAPDPADPTRVVRRDGKSYVYTTFVHIIKQIEGGATVINMSYGPDKPNDGNRELNYLYRKFLSKVAQKYPKVVFVAAAGNEGKKNVDLDGRNYWPGGIKLPNVITVGALDDEGNRAAFSNRATGDGEVTISAPGVKMVLGVGPDGKPVKASGTSFSSPQVAAAAAMLRSINPDLTAEQIKSYLAKTAGPGVTNKNSSTPIPQGMGKGVLRVDRAVLEVINDMRKPQPPLKVEELVKLATIEGSAAAKGPKDYGITARLTAVGDNPADVKIELRGSGLVLKGSPSQRLSRAGELGWEATLTDVKANPTIRLRRLDTDAFCDISIEAVDLNGEWQGTLTATDAFVASDISIPDPFDDKKEPTVIKKEECEQALKEGMNKASELKLDFKSQSPEAGTVVLITQDTKGKETPTEPWPYRFDGSRVTFDGTQSGAKIHFEGTVSVAGAEYNMSGPFTMTFEEKGQVAMRLSGTFTVAKPKPAPAAPAKPGP
ncbi:MAG: S8 family serine peptidase [Chloroflexi bacterium]|nr:S8 family serine peptidase [Chloroflexota bacterium]